MKKTLVVLLFTVVTLTSIASYGALTVVGDLGGESTAPFFDAINALPGEFSPPESLSPSTTPAEVTVASALPVITPELTPGPVAARALNLPGMPPVFIVGDDDLSRQWLLRRAAELTHLGATGFVVNVADLGRLQSLKALFPGAEMAPVSGSDLARRLQLAHYPLLITAKGLAQ